MAAETLCPSCGFGPLEGDADSCPKCNTTFALNPLYKRSRVAGGAGIRKDEEDLEATRTTYGGITGAVDAHPLPTATILGLSSFVWLMRCAGVLSDRPEPWWPLALAAVQMGGAMLLLVSAGPARQLAQISAVAQLACAYYAGGTAVTRVGFVGVGLALLLMTSGEPSNVRRWVGTGAGLAMLMFGAAGVVIGPFF